MIQSGFFDSMNHDRVYNVSQMSTLFDGIINDGVFASIGNHFHVTPGVGLQVFVDTGKAWFDHTWTTNDTIFAVNLSEVPLYSSRIDTIVLDINSEQAVRANTITVVDGIASESPVPTDLINTENHHQYPLAYVTVANDTTQIAIADIENKVGTDDCPFVNGIIDRFDVETLLDRWNDQYQAIYQEMEAAIAQAVQQQIAYGAVSTEIQVTIPSDPTLWTGHGDSYDITMDVIGLIGTGSYKDRPIMSINTEELDYTDTDDINSMKMFLSGILKASVPTDGHMYILASSIPKIDTPVKLLVIRK